MKRILFILLVVTSCSMAFSQSAEGRYNSRMTRDGMLFFVMPERLKDTSGLKKFEYDMTLLTWTDYVTVNYTFESTSLSMPKDFVIKSGKDEFVCTSYSSLFIDIKKNRYEIRITSKFSIGDIEQIMHNIDPPRFEFKQDGMEKWASYTKKSWKKDQKKLIDILNLYKLSK